MMKIILKLAIMLSFVILIFSVSQTVERIVNLENFRLNLQKQLSFKSVESQNLLRRILSCSFITLIL